jgi:nucleotide-binding universal stress UspA family protein
MTRFLRLVLEVGHGAIDADTMREAAAFALLMDAELHTLFVEDETLLHASALPFAREINPLSGQWRRLETGRLEAELRAAADRARQQLMEATNAIGARQSFEVRRGDVALHITEICVATDIVVVSSLDRIGAGSRRLRETARGSVASVLFLPSRPGRRHGVIAAVAAGADDPAVDIAREIAAREETGLMVVGSVGALANARERLIVLTRDGTEDGADLASVRGVPVLVLEPV